MSNEKVRPQPWIPEEDYRKLEGQVRLKLNAILGVFDVYGQGAFIPETREAIIQVVRWYGLRLRGVDKIPHEMLLYLRGRGGK